MVWTTQTSLSRIFYGTDRALIHSSFWIVNICWVGCQPPTPLCCSKNVVILLHRNYSQRVADAIPKQRGWNEWFRDLQAEPTGSHEAFARVSVDIQDVRSGAWGPCSHLWEEAESQDRFNLEAVELKRLVTCLVSEWSYSWNQTNP